jgi:bacteriocin biosynthesis cyclodehydratase domain-containing protein
MAHDEIMRRQLLFWGRHLDVTRNARLADEVQRRLATSRLVLVGTGLFGAITYDILTRSGCADIRVLDWDDDGLFLETLAGGATQPRQAIHLSTISIDEATSWLRYWAEDADLVVTATRNAPWALFRAINRICLDQECPWLCANIAATQIEVGPYVRPYGSACFACMELRLASAQDFSIEERLYQEHLTEPRPAGQTPPVGESLFASTLAASLLVGEVVRVVTGIAASTLLNGVLTISPLNGSFQVNRILRVPRCPECFRGALAPLHEGEPHD